MAKRSQLRLLHLGEGPSVHFGVPAWLENDLEGRTAGARMVTGIAIDMAAGCGALVQARVLQMSGVIKWS